MADVDLRKYIGRPYEKFDCFDLVKEFYQDFFNLSLRHYFDGTDKPSPKEAQSLIVSNKGDFIPVNGKHQFGDLAVIRLYGLECHIGVIISGTTFLHSAKNIGSNIDRLERYSRLIAGVYRHREVTL